MTPQFPDCLNDLDSDSSSAMSSSAAATAADNLAATANATVAADTLAIAGALKALGQPVLDYRQPTAPVQLSSSDGTTITRTPLLAGTIPFPFQAPPPVPPTP